MSFNMFKNRYGLQDNNWMGHSMMKPADCMEFQKRKALMEGNNDENDNFEMDILDEGTLDKALEGPGKLYTGKLWKKIYEVIDDEYFKQLDIEFPKEFILKFKQEFNFSHFIPVDVKKSIQKIGL